MNYKIIKEAIPSPTYNHEKNPYQLDRDEIEYIDNNLNIKNKCKYVIFEGLDNLGKTSVIKKIQGLINAEPIKSENISDFIFIKEPFEFNENYDPYFTSYFFKYCYLSEYWLNNNYNNNEHFNMNGLITKYQNSTPENKKYIFEYQNDILRYYYNQNRFSEWNRRGFLNFNNTIISDRSFLSTLAYQHSKMHEVYIPKIPELVFYFYTEYVYDRDDDKNYYHQHDLVSRDLYNIYGYNKRDIMYNYEKYLNVLSKLGTTVMIVPIPSIKCPENYIMPMINDSIIQDIANDILQYLKSIKQ